MEESKAEVEGRRKGERLRRGERRQERGRGGERVLLKEESETLHLQGDPVSCGGGTLLLSRVRLGPPCAWAAWSP